MQESKSGTSQAQTIIITAISLFALSGFVVGFAFGAFTRPQGDATQPTAQNHDIPIVSQKTPPTPLPTPQLQLPSLGCPDVEANVSQMVADGKTAYGATIQAKDKTGNQGDKCPDIAQEKPVVADGITCKIWLTKAQDSSGDLIKDASQLQHVDQLNNPSPNEIPSGLIFDPNTPQVQPCKQGQGHWKFAISPTVSPGDYFIVGLTDLQGVHYNWSWYQFQVGNKNQSKNQGQQNQSNQQAGQLNQGNNSIVVPLP
jgi:hypothetical protein